MGKVWVQVCASNPAARPDGLPDRLGQDPGRYVVERVSCLDSCTLCERLAFALVNGRLLTAESVAELVAEIRREEPSDLAPAPMPAGGRGRTYPEKASE